ncbi:MAG: hypothetical protein IIW54_05010 [Lachnospiraceae bacterium]|nr:hypothetical protein [Lachnospiraceae bacterium]
MFNRKRKTIIELTDKLIYLLERINLTDYVEYLGNTNRILYTSFLIGLARGFGSAIGFSLLGAVVIYIVVETGVVNLPAIREYLRNMIGGI